MIAAIANKRGTGLGKRRTLLLLGVLVAGALVFFFRESVFGPKLIPIPVPALELADAGVAEKVKSVVAELEASPRSKSNWARLAQTLEVHGFYPEAILAYGQTERLDAEDFRWPYFRGVCEQREDPVAASRSYRRALSQKPDHVPLHVHLGETLLRLEKLEEARAAFEKALELDPKCAPAHQGLGSIALRRNDLPSARQSALRATQLAPGYQDAHRLLAQVLSREGKSEAADRAQAQSDACGSEIPLPDQTRDAVWWNHGVSVTWRRQRAAQFARAGRFSDVAREWREYLARHSEDAAAHAELAVALYSLGESDTAEEHAARARRLDPGSTAEIHLTMGAALARVGRDALAISQFQKALEAKPDLLQAIVQLGTALARSGKVEEGLNHLRRAVRSAPKDETALFHLGSRLQDAELFDEAVLVFENLASVAPRHKDVFDQWAMCLTRLRRPAEALAVLRRGVSVMPENGTTANRLAWMLACGPEPEFRNGSEALAIAKSLCEATQYGSPVLLDTLAAAAAEAGDFPTAVKTLETALELCERGRARGTVDPTLLEHMRGRLERYYRVRRAYHGPP